MKLSTNLTLAEAIKSQQAIRKGLFNNPNADQVEALKAVAVNIFQRVRDHFGKPIMVTSGFRSVAVNASIGGSGSSQHCKGEALDIDGDIYGKPTNREIFYYIKDNLEFDQLIWEYGDASNPAWVHASYKRPSLGSANRNQVLRCYRDEKGNTKYIQFDL